MGKTVEEHYRQLLRLEAPWMVTAVEKDLAKETVTVCVRWPERTAVGCPQCGEAGVVHDRLP